MKRVELTAAVAIVEVGLVLMPVLLGRGDKIKLPEIRNPKAAVKLVAPPVNSVPVNPVKKRSAAAAAAQPPAPKPPRPKLLPEVPKVIALQRPEPKVAPKLAPLYLSSSGTRGSELRIFLDSIWLDYVKQQDYLIVVAAWDASPGDEGVLIRLKEDRAWPGPIPSGYVPRVLEDPLPEEVARWRSRTRHHFGVKPVGVFVLYPPRDYLALQSAAQRQPAEVHRWVRTEVGFQLQAR